MKKIFSNTSNSIRILTLIGAMMLGLGLMTNNSFADDSHDRNKAKHCDKKRDGHKRHDGDLSNVLKMLDKKLELTEDQKTSISKVIDQYNPELKELASQMRDGKKAEREIMRQDSFDEAAITKQAQQNADLMVKMIVLKSKAKHTIHSYLTDEQKTELEEMFKKRRQKREGRKDS